MDGLPLGQGALRFRLFRPALRVGRAADQGRPGLCRRPDPGRDQQGPRNCRHSRHGESLAQPQRGREPPSLQGDEGREICRRGEGPPREDRHGIPEHDVQGPAPVQDQACFASPHRRQMVHLPDVRLHARAMRLHRAHNPLDLHPGIRRAQAALRLVHQDPQDLALAPVRIRQAQPHLHPDEQAQAPRTGPERPGLGVGRSQDAYPVRRQETRLHRRGPEDVLREDRRFQTRPDDGHPAA